MQAIDVQGKHIKFCHRRNGRIPLVDRQAAVTAAGRLASSLLPPVVHFPRKFAIRTISFEQECPPFVLGFGV